MGARSAEFNLGDTQKLFVQGRDPHGLLRSASAIYRLCYDTGSRTYHASGAHKAVLRTLQANAYSTWDCLTVVGWHEKAIELCGGRNPQRDPHQVPRPRRRTVRIPLRVGLTPSVAVRRAPATRHLEEEPS